MTITGQKMGRKMGQKIGQKIGPKMGRKMGQKIGQNGSRNCTRNRPKIGQLAQLHLAVGKRRLFSKDHISFLIKN